MLQVVLVIPGHLVAIQLDAEAWPFRHRERTADVREWLGHDIVGLMVIVRVDSIRQIGGRSREVDGGRRRDPQLAVAVHAQADLERLAHARELLIARQAAPVVDVRQDDVDAARFYGKRDLVEVDHAHVGGQRHRDVASQQRHAFDAPSQILGVLELHVHQPPERVDGRADRPRGVGIEAEADVGEPLAQQPQRARLLLGPQDSALQLEHLEAVVCDELLGIGHERFWRVLAAAAVGAGVAVEEIPGARHLVTEPAAQQRAHGALQHLPHDVPAGHVDRSDDVRRHERLVRDAEHLQPADEAIQLERVGAEQHRAHELERADGGVAAIGLAEADHTFIGDELHDRPGGAGLHAQAPAERRFHRHGDGRQLQIGDLHRVGVRPSPLSSI